MFQFPPLTPFVRKLVIALFATWILQILLTNWAGVPTFDLLALDAGQPGVHTLWQVGTYVFAAPLSFGILITLLFIWLMLAPFEQRFGQTHVIRLCVATLLAAAGLALALGAMTGTGVLYGANLLVLSSFSAFSWSYRGQGNINLFGVVQLKPMHAIYLVLGLSVIGFLISKDLVSLGADLGAIGAGIGYIEWLKRPPKTKKPKKPKKRRGKTSDFSVISGGRDDKPKWLN